MKKIFIPILSLIICTTILWKWTFGFNDFTIFSYTLTKAGKTPREFPTIQLVNQQGNVFNIKDKHKYILMNFVYLNCPNVCHKVNNQLEKLYHLIDTNIAPSQLEFVTVSFDIKNDNIEKIEKYRHYFGENIDGWTFALPYQIKEQAFLQYLQNIGIWAYKMPESNIINHAIYLLLISPDNKIIKTFDPARESNADIIEQLTQCLQEK
ncbi:MAG: SCO family protein [Chitinophagaceae bacterium]|nr:SCO family protein [Chitinophagaceae bacterium]MCW5904356.1 SCO family protein [Chitinophagaceae bacterium]